MYLPLGFAAAIVSLLLAIHTSATAEEPVVTSHSPPYSSFGKIERHDPRFDMLIPLDAKLEKLAEGFDWSEGPVWMKQGGFLLFSDIPRNRVMKWKEGEGVSLFMKPAGYTGVVDYLPEPGSNGLSMDPEGRLVLCEHGDRRLAVLTKDGGKMTIVDRYEGKRLNSPNDACFKSNGDLYFTDPPYGLPKGWNDPRRELDFCGVYRVSKDGKVTLLTTELTRPNGIAFSNDEQKLYVAQSDPDNAIWVAYEVKADGTLGAGKVFFNATPWVREGRKGLPDGLKVDKDGNLFAAGPGGVHIFAPDGTLLGSIDTGQPTGNCAWGDDGSTLYVLADMYVGRIKTLTKGAGW
ncbi:MAG: SMP-30/gluconolactonase/LRE family protein [Pirellulales bacterium]|nr:SMP-30/gluconolactonase/LRE family protein [Pirellulales bacterium]